MRYVIVLTSEIENLEQLTEMIEAIRAAEIPHLEGSIHVGIHEVADRILSEFE